MLIENPSSSFIVIFIVFCLIAVVSTAVKALQKPKGYVWGWLACGLFSTISLYYVTLSMTSYTALEISQSDEPNSDCALTARFASARFPLTIRKGELRTILIEQKWTQRKHGPENWYEVILETRDGSKLRPNWSISENALVEYAQLVLFVRDLKEKNMPLSYSYTDKHGHTHLTHSITERPDSQVRL